jgi:hypothetical protein
MAYVNFTELHEAVPALTAPRAVVQPEKPALSPLEWSVVALAQKDRLSSIDRPGRVALAMGRLFGSRRGTDLADPRLEALRRLAVIAWHRGYAIATAEIRKFLEAGFSMAQYELVLASISRGRDARNQRVH